MSTVLDAKSNTRRRYAVLLLHAGGPENLQFQSLWRYMSNQLSNPRIMDLMPQLMWKPILWSLVLPGRIRAEKKLFQSQWVYPGVMEEILASKEEEGSDKKELDEKKSMEEGQDDAPLLAAEMEKYRSTGTSVTAFYTELLVRKVEACLKAAIQKRVENEIKNEEPLTENADDLISVDVRWASIFRPESVENALKEFNLLGNYSNAVDTEGNPVITVEEHLFVLPLYPQYTSLHAGVAWDVLSRSSYFINKRTIPSFTFIRGYCEHPLYVRMLELYLRRYVKQNGVPNDVFITFPGIPKRFVQTGDCYQVECVRTFNLLRSILAEAFVGSDSEEGETKNIENESYYSESFKDIGLHMGFLPYGLEPCITPRVEVVASQVAEKRQGSSVPKEAASEINSEKKEGSDSNSNSELKEAEEEEKNRDTNEMANGTVEERKSLGTAYVFCPGNLMDDARQSNLISRSVNRELNRLGWEHVLLIPFMNDEHHHVSFLVEYFEEMIMKA